MFTFIYLTLRKNDRDFMTFIALRGTLYNRYDDYTTREMQTSSMAIQYTYTMYNVYIQHSESVFWNNSHLFINIYIIISIT